MFQCVNNSNNKQDISINGKCLHIGCGLVAPKDWENIDSSPSLRIAKIPLIGHSLQSLVSDVPWPRSVKYGDLVKGLKIEPNSCALIYSSHVLEHLSLSDFHIAMNNIYSYLKPGGTFRAIVPDLEQYISIYKTHRSDRHASATAAHEFMTGSFLGYSEHRSTLLQRFRHAFSNCRHQWMWDEPSLSTAFINIGFKHVRRCYYGDWSDSRFASVEKPNRYLKAIGIEGKKIDTLSV